MKHVFLPRVALLMGLLFVVSPGAGLVMKLEIIPVCQQTPMWCWAAVGELVFWNYGVPMINPMRGYQCGILSELDGSCWNNCTACRVSAGQLDIILATIETYPKIAAEMTSLETRSIRA